MNKAKAGTFVLNMGEPIHRWYSYVEGYSSCLVSRELDLLFKQGAKITTLYDPFSGTGTTGIVASIRGIEPFYSESNPFMQFVTETKADSIVSQRSQVIEERLIYYKNLIQKRHMGASAPSWGGFEKYFEESQLADILSIKAVIDQEKDELIKNILMLALSSILVKSSKMVRRGDLRYATEKEYKKHDVFQLFTEKLNMMIADIYEFDGKMNYGITKISDDARLNTEVSKFDCAITSPPYLNGTNYIRNTKLELKLNGFVESEKELPRFHSKGIIAGINNVSKRSGQRPVLNEIKQYVIELEKKAYDDRIPKMIAGYFYDMNVMIRQLALSLKNGGYFIMDIGDSQFAGVHIPTHIVLKELCEKHGLKQYSEDVLRTRRSKNGMILSQRILRFQKEE